MGSGVENAIVLMPSKGLAVSGLNELGAVEGLRAKVNAAVGLADGLAVDVLGGSPFRSA